MSTDGAHNYYIFRPPPPLWITSGILVKKWSHTEVIMGNTCGKIFAHYLMIQRGSGGVIIMGTIGTSKWEIYSVSRIAFDFFTMFKFWLLLTKKCNWVDQLILASKAMNYSAENISKKYPWGLRDLPIIEFPFFSAFGSFFLFTFVTHCLSCCLRPWKAISSSWPKIPN